jgi:DNA polymerase III sliding clamp (beta) subunit (PCNA family)
MVKDGYITGFDLNTAVSARVDLEGQFLIPEKAISLIQSVTDDEIFIEEKDGSVIVKFGKSKSKFQTMPFDDYPLLPDISLLDETIIDLDELKEGISKVAYAVAPKEGKPILQDVKITDGELAAVDGIRLASYETGCNFTTVLPCAIIKPLNRLYGKGSVYVTEKHVTIETDEARIVARRQSGEFADYKKFIPTRNNYFDVDRKKLLYIVELIGKIANDKLKKPITFEVSDGIAKISYSDTSGEFYDEFEVEAPDIKIGLNAFLLGEALKSFDDKVQMSLDTPLTPILLKNDKQLALILPVRLTK